MDSETSRKFNSVESRVSQLSIQIDYLDNQSQRNNIRIDILKGVEGERWDSAEASAIVFSLIWAFMIFRSEGHTGWDQKTRIDPELSS